MFHTDLYVKVFPNRIHVKNVSSGQVTEAVPSTPYVSSRILIGNISSAEFTLKQAIDNVKPSNPLKRFRNRVLIHPIIEFQGGITEAEERLFRMIVFDAFPSQVVVWVGAELSDQMVLEKLNASK